MYQIYVDRDKLEIKITKIKNTFRGTKEEGEAWRNPTKIVSYNINGIRAAQKLGLLEWVESFNADVFCFQEVRCTEELTKEILSGCQTQINLFVFIS